MRLITAFSDPADWAVPTVGRIAAASAPARAASTTC
jgi:hypothetical protein